MKVRSTIIPERENTLACLQCAKRKCWRRFKTAMAAGAVVIGTAAAGYCVYQQRLVTFIEVAHFMYNAIDWLDRRDYYDDLVQKELSAVRRELDDARRDRKTLIDQQRQMEQILKGCIYQP